MVLFVVRTNAYPEEVTEGTSESLETVTQLLQRLQNGVLPQVRRIHYW